VVWEEEWVEEGELRADEWVVLVWDQLESAFALSVARVFPISGVFPVFR
jgi:hypothetical protein